jgi:hypothetical protein
MTGRITRLIDDQQLGTIAGEDGLDYIFRSGSLINTQFAALHVGATVIFTPTTVGATGRAVDVRTESK